MAESNRGGADIFCGIENEFAPLPGTPVAFEIFPFLRRVAGDERDIERAANCLEELFANAGAAGEFSTDVDGVEIEVGESATPEGVEEEEEAEAVFAAAQGDSDFFCRCIDEREVENGLTDTAFKFFAESSPWGFG